VDSIVYDQDGRSSNENPEAIRTASEEKARALGSTLIKNDHVKELVKLLASMLAGNVADDPSLSPRIRVRVIVMVAVGFRVKLGLGLGLGSASASALESGLEII